MQTLQAVLSGAGSSGQLGIRRTSSASQAVAPLTQQRPRGLGRRASGYDGSRTAGCSVEASPRRPSRPSGASFELAARGRGSPVATPLEAVHELPPLGTWAEHGLGRRGSGARTAPRHGDRADAAVAEPGQLPDASATAAARTAPEPVTALDV